MPLPPIAFYSIYEVAARMGCHPADVAGWAATGQLTAMIGIEPVQCGETLHGGLVEVSMADLMPLFRRFGPSDETCRLKRILPEGGRDWVRVTAPAKGIPVRATDLMFPADAVRSLEEERNHVQRPSHGIGAGPRYDWEAMTVWLFKRLNERGFPASQAALIAEVQDWFVAHSTTVDVPEDSTIRKRIAPIWRAVRGSE
jgi:hypothetical protein